MNYMIYIGTVAWASTNGSCMTGALLKINFMPVIKNYHKMVVVRTMMR